jgi:hypothetical protein
LLWHRALVLARSHQTDRLLQVGERRLKAARQQLVRAGTQEVRERVVGLERDLRACLPSVRAAIPTLRPMLT